MKKIKIDPDTMQPIERIHIVGEFVYIPSKFHVYRGRDDIKGGLAEIIEVRYSKRLPYNHCNHIMVVFKGFSGSEYNWRSLMEEQEKLKEQFGKELAKPDPDDRPEFNDDREGWKSI